MTITPDWAWDIICQRNTLNRDIRPDRISKYIKDIISGNWEVINNGIGFYEDGTLADGQHRLLAVSEAKISVEAIVVFGMKKSSLPRIDEGASRNTKDVAQLMGLDVGYAQLGIANYILEYKDLKRDMPRAEQIAFYERHKDAINFVTTKLKRKNVSRVPVSAALARAWYSVDHDILSKFLTVLDTGLIESPKDQAAITLREFLLKNNNHSGPFRAEVYRKTQAALMNFIEGKPITRLYGMEEEQFLLPEEKLEASK